VAPLRREFFVDAPPERVFDFLANVDNETRWNPDVRSAERIGSGPIAQGAEWNNTYRGLGSMRVRIDRYERPRLLGFSTFGDRLDMDIAFEFFPHENGTRVAASGDVKPKGAMRLMQPMMGFMMRRTFERRPAQIAAGLRSSG
jgi:carbon monoxide dehydrogenase subunit G